MQGFWAFVFLIVGTCNVGFSAGECSFNPGDRIPRPYTCDAGKGSWTFEDDGNMVIYDISGTTLWSTNTGGGEGDHASFQADGNFVIYDIDGGVAWRSATQDRGSRLVFQDNRNLVIYDSTGNSIWTSVTAVAQGILYPQESESREVKSLDGIWHFRVAPRLNPDIGFVEQWQTQSLAKSGEVELMPVPSSFNDVTQKKELRDHVGWAWYDRTFWVPSGWQTGRRIFLRFGAANYNTIVYVNGVEVVQHSGGALPFYAELTPSTLKFNESNRVTVAINNTLTPDTLPQGRIEWQVGTGYTVYPEGAFVQRLNFDFFNYAGIHRSVFLYSTPLTYIDDITVIPSVVGTTGSVEYSVQVAEGTTSTVNVALLDRDDNLVATGQGAEGTLNVPNAKLWWPFTMVQNDADAGYLHTLQVTVADPNNPIPDVYRLKVGIRSIKYSATEFLINDKPFYFRGFGRHEDYNARGKGVDNVMLVKDHNLVKWTGANSYRTSHYPYAEEIMDLTDELGIVVIDEVPAVGLSAFGAVILANHKTQLQELIQRDKNRPSVVMWSMANEPANPDAADAYFKEITEYTRAQDVTKRPITSVSAGDYGGDKPAQYLDVLSVNRYWGWYQEPGNTGVILPSLNQNVRNWIDKYQKPLMIAEYGSDTISGLHLSPEFVWTEEYQTELMRQFFKSFDFLRANTSFIGEHIWNFADFMTLQDVGRVGGNRKGIFTRDRHPKASAHLIRQRYHLIANEYDNYPIPEEIEQTFTPIYSRKHIHDEH